MSGRVVLNIGWARAASTAFRANFLRRHPDILVVGRDEPLAAELLLQLKTAGDADFARSAAGLRVRWDAWTQRQARPVICLSDEELSIGVHGAGVAPVTIARRCGLLFPGARTLALVRDPVEAIRSFHALAERHGATAGLPAAAWALAHFIRPGRDGFAYLFDYAATLQGYLAWQPRGDLIVLDHRRLETAHADAYAQVARALAIDAQACEALPNDILNASPAVASGMDEVEDAIRSLYRRSSMELAAQFGIAFPPARAVATACPAGTDP